MNTKKKFLNVLSNFIFSVFLIVFIFLMYIAVKGIATGREPEIFNYKMYYVNSGSMSPTINIGSLILVEKKENTSIDIQDVVTFRTSNKTVVTHRLVGVADNGNYLTRGDANTSNDPMTLNKDSIIGKVVCSLPYVGFLMSVLKTPLGMAGLIISIITIILTFYLLDYYKKKKNQKFEV